jgi:hypothetical protein
MSKLFPKNRPCQLFLDFLVLSRFRVFLSDGSAKTLLKLFAKKSCRKDLTKKSTKQSKPILSRFCFITLFIPENPFHPRSPMKVSDSSARRQVTDCIAGTQEAQSSAGR